MPWRFLNNCGLWMHRAARRSGSPAHSGCLTWVAALFGSYDAQTGVRHIKEVLSLSPRKQQVHAGCRDHDDGAVTELAAGGGLHHSGPDRGGGG